MSEPINAPKGIVFHTENKEAALPVYVSGFLTTESPDGMTQIVFYSERRKFQRLYLSRHLVEVRDDKMEMEVRRSRVPLNISSDDYLHVIRRVEGAVVVSNATVKELGERCSRIAQSSKGKEASE